MSLSESGLESSSREALELYFESLRNEEQHGMENVTGNIYDYPVYYDLVFASDWVAEFKFLEATFKKHVDVQNKKAANFFSSLDFNRLCMILVY